jgi:ELP3 family radical SAM enzyme/protein acetyltransferase
MSCVGKAKRIADMEDLIKYNESYDPVKNMNKSIMNNTIDNIDINNSCKIINNLLTWIEKSINNNIDSNNIDSNNIDSNNIDSNINNNETIIENNFDIRTIMDVNDDFNKKFQQELNKEIRKHKTYNRKSLLLNVINLVQNEKHNNNNSNNNSNNKINISTSKKVLNNMDFMSNSDKEKSTLEILNLEKEKEEKKEEKESQKNNNLKNVNLQVIRNINNFDKLYIESLKLLLRKKPTRNLSGITSITVITSPHPNGQTFSCKHDCFYCPNEKAHEGNNWQDQPRSYLFREPAVLRANRNEFLAFDQMISRMDTLMVNGHVIDKLEIIVEGGTYTEYPAEYLEIYHRDLFYAANIYFDLKALFEFGSISRETLDDGANIRLIAEKIGYEVQEGREYFVDQHILKYCIDKKLIREPGSIAEEIKYNERAKTHIIGVCIETRPDAIDNVWVRRFREWGVTRIQLGVQHTDNFILKKINRGHTIEKALWAIEYLKNHCFKIDIHIMPDLPYSSPDKDREMFDYVYSVICPDQMKIYPCQITPWTKIEKWYREGKFTPYFDNNPRDLIDVVKYAMLNCPNYIRLPRVIRDIPIGYVGSGNTYPNMRQIIDDEFAKDGLKAKDIRSREIGRNSKYYKMEAEYNIYQYQANDGLEYFICYESKDKIALFGFIRLRIVDLKKYSQDKNETNEFPCLIGRGLIRELHVYGNTNQVGSTLKGKGKECVQHTGIGGNLLKLAEKITMKHGFNGIVVISGEGVKGYYRKNGYHEEDTFMIKDFKLIFVIWYMIYNMFIDFMKKYFINYLI